MIFKSDFRLASSGESFASNKQVFCIHLLIVICPATKMRAHGKTLASSHGHEEPSISRLLPLRPVPNPPRASKSIVRVKFHPRVPRSDLCALPNPRKSRRIILPIIRHILCFDGKADQRKILIYRSFGRIGITSPLAGDVTSLTYAHGARL